jgi:DNA-binding NarL/FixJ family response regulator
MTTIRVFIVEDHGLVRNGVRALIQQQHDMEVVGESPGDVRTIGGIKLAFPDVVVMDLALSGCSGIGMTRELLATEGGLGVLAFTMHKDGSLVHEFVKAGGVGYVLKRSGAPTLLSAIRAVAAGSKYFDPELSHSDDC